MNICVTFFEKKANQRNFIHYYLMLPLLLILQSAFRIMHCALCALGGDDGIRTHDPLLAGQVLSQLSYTPIFQWFAVIISYAHFVRW